MSASFDFSSDAALQMLQQAATAIVDWAAAKNSSTNQNPAALHLVFDRIRLSPEPPNQSRNYRPARALEVQDGEETPRIPYPTEECFTEQDFAVLKEQICAAAQHLNWQNLSQLMLFLEIYGSHLSWGEPDADIAIVDQAKSTAAIAAALAQNPPGNKLALVGGDLMGVQKFIYTISSEGALKSLRARSFYLELATEEVVQQILEALELPRTNVIYSGASKFYLLVAATDKLDKTLQEIQTKFNDWLLKNFQRKVFLAIAHETFPAEQLQPTQASEEPPLTQIWQNLNDKLTAQASRKFEHQLDKILDPQRSYPTPCKVCHRDDVPEEKLKLLNELEDDSVLACCTCRTMYRLGGQLLHINAIVRSPRQNLSPQCLRIKLESGTIHYYLFDDRNEAFHIADDTDSILLVNDWDISHYQTSQIIPLLYANYGQASKVEFEENDKRKPSTMQAAEFAQEAEGIKRVGYLRMDVDRLSQIFSQGLGKAYTLPRLTSLSRQMTYFFKVYLNSLADARQPNFIRHCDSLNLKRLLRNPPKDPIKDLDKNLRKNLLFIYAGGDDLFISGAWDEVVVFAFDVYQAFRAYTGNHPDVTLSGGISLNDAKYPLYQAAADAKDAEDDAKGNGRDSLGLFGEVFKWSEWLGVAEPTVLTPEAQEYLKPEMKPSLFGVLPFVERLDQQLEINQSRSFVRNLLTTAQMQTQMLKQIKDQKSDDAKGIRYYLHLPKIAYTLARLPSKVRDDPAFDSVRTSLKSPYNAPYFRAIATWIELLNRTSR